ELLDEGCLVRHNIPIQGATRMSLAVFERATGQEYRFVPEGPLVAEAEWQAALDFCAAIECEWLVASGSLPRGVPADFYARLSAILIRRGIRLIVDTSGAALSAVLEAGGVFLAKPSQGEFEALTGTTYASAADIGEAAMAFVRSGKVQHLTVTLGHLGAVMAYPGGVDIRPALPVEVKSATGAGDSFVAGILHGFARGEDATGAFRWGMAAGTAAVLTPGTDLCQSADIRRLHATMG
ncbi:MAG: PfkB family carbohydrate kinase, partial [Novosphingobium sp.]